MLLDIQRPDTFIRFMRDSLPKENILLRKRVENFMDSVKCIVISEKEIYPQITHEILEELYNIRVEVFPELSNNENFYSGEIRDKAFKEILSFDNNGTAILAENISFSFRCFRKVERALLPQIQNLIEEQKSQGIKIEIPSYSEIINSLLAISHDKNSILTIRFINTTLYIEFVIISFYLINNKKVRVPETVIDQLCRIVADSTQDYLAYATELGFLNQYISENQNLKIKVTKKIIKEQKELAEVGFDDWAKNLDK